MLTAVIGWAGSPGVVTATSRMTGAGAALGEASTIEPQAPQSGHRPSHLGTAYPQSSQ
jgi:hypothetical protein